MKNKRRCWKPASSGAPLTRGVALSSVIFGLSIVLLAMGQTHPSLSAPQDRAKSSPKNGAENGVDGAKQTYPELIDIAASTGIQFEHLSSPEQKFIVESMSGGVALIDYDGDGWLDIYFTNAQTVQMALEGKKARSALFHNNRDGTFRDVTDKAGVGYPCWAMGVW